MNNWGICFEWNLWLSVKANKAWLIIPEDPYDILLWPDYLSKWRELPPMDYVEAFYSDDLAEVMKWPEFDFEEDNFRVVRDNSWKEVTHNWRTIYVNPEWDIIEIDWEQYFTPQAGFIEAKWKITIPSNQQIDFLNEKHWWTVDGPWSADNLITQKKIKLLWWIDAYYNLKWVWQYWAYLIRWDIGKYWPNVWFFSKAEWFDFQSRYLWEFFPMRWIKYK